MSNPKIITRYLPQYHEVEENNIWHWKGFTERVNVKKAKPLYKWHIQPKIPYNYYNLLNKDVRRKQGELAKEYWIYWFCYYHYRFEGKKLLEKPIEKLLEDGYPDLNFCFSWANHSWTRKWWGEGKDETLLEQTYWLEDDWNQHFHYLLPFFQHKNYILVDNKPLFLIYNIKDIKSYDKMLEYRNNLAKESWFEGIYVLETLNSYNNKQVSDKTDWIVQFEPLLTLSGKNMPYMYKFLTGFKLILSKYFKINFIHKFNYDIIWKSILKQMTKNKIKNWKAYFWWFPNRDNTPRKQRKWYIITWSSPQKFEKYFKKLMEKSIKNQNEFVFVNAWNEWAEWCYLEPDLENKDWYLKSIKKT